MAKAAGAARERSLGGTGAGLGLAATRKRSWKASARLHPGLGRAVSAEWGEGLHKHLPLLSLALELAKEGPGQWTRQREGAPASAPRLPRAWCPSRGQGPQGPRRRQLWAPLSSLGSSLSPCSLVERGLHLGPVLLILTAHCEKCRVTGWSGEKTTAWLGAGAGIGPWAQCMITVSVSHITGHTCARVHTRAHAHTHTILSSGQRCAQALALCLTHGHRVNLSLLLQCGGHQGPSIHEKREQHHHHDACAEQQHLLQGAPVGRGGGSGGVATG